MPTRHHLDTDSIFLTVAAIATQEKYACIVRRSQARPFLTLDSSHDNCQSGVNTLQIPNVNTKPNQGDATNCGPFNNNGNHTLPKSIMTRNTSELIQA